MPRYICKTQKIFIFCETNVIRGSFLKKKSDITHIDTKRGFTSQNIR